jgi:PAS domain S-box-containing protein
MATTPPASAARAGRPSHGKGRRGWDDAWLRLLVDCVPTLLWTTDRALRVTALQGGGPGSPRTFPLGDLLGPTGERGPAAGGNDGLVAAHHRALEGERSSFSARWEGKLFRGRVAPARDTAGRILGCLGVAVDDTEPEQERWRLVEAERRLAKAQAVAHVGSWERDLASDRYLFSEEACRLLGLHPGGCCPTRREFVNLVHPDDRAAVERHGVLVQSRPGPDDYDFRVVRPDTGVRVIHVQMEAFLGDGGGGRIVGACQDVTEQRAAAAQLQRTLSLLEGTLESTADGLLVVDLEGNMVRYNARFAAIWGIPETILHARDDGLAQSFARDKVIDPDGFSARIEQLQTDTDVESYDEIRLRDGRILERYSQPQRLHGQPVGRVWSFRDVSEQRRAEAARDQLIAAERAAREAAQAAAQRAALLAEASRLLSSLDHESALDSLAALCTESFADCCAVDVLDRSGHVRRLAEAHAHPGNSDLPSAALPLTTTVSEQDARAHLGVPLSITGRMIGALTFGRDRKRGFSRADLVLAEDLAGRAALATEIARLYHETRAALSAREEFLSVASHELRAPLAALQATTDGMRAGIYSSEPVAEGSALDRPLRAIARQVRRLSSVVNALLDAAALFEKGIALEVRDTDLSDIAEAVVRRVRADVGPRGELLELATPGPVVGRWDAQRLDQVIATLVSNAVRYGEGKPIRVTVERAGGVARLVVRDHGVGIAPGKLPTLFSRFERAGAPRSYGGLGLGLYIASHVVQAHGGTMHVESQPGQGSTFVVELPLAGPEGAAA